MTKPRKYEPTSVECAETIIELTKQWRKERDHGKRKEIIFKLAFSAESVAKAYLKHLSETPAF